MFKETKHVARGPESPLSSPAPPAAAPPAPAPCLQNKDEFVAMGGPHTPVAGTSSVRYQPL